MPARIVVGPSKVAELSKVEVQQRGDAADRLWQELVHAVNAPDQPAAEGRKRRGKSGQ